MNKLRLSFSLAALTIVLSTPSYASENLEKEKTNHLANPTFRSDDNLKNTPSQYTGKNYKNYNEDSIKSLLKSIKEGQQITFHTMEQLIFDTAKLMDSLKAEDSFKNLSVSKLDIIKKVAILVYKMPNLYDDNVTNLEPRLTKFNLASKYYDTNYRIFRNLSEVTDDPNEQLCSIFACTYYLEKFCDTKSFDNMDDIRQFLIRLKLGALKTKIADSSTSTLPEKVNLYSHAAEEYKNSFNYYGFAADCIQPKLIRGFINCGKKSISNYEQARDLLNSKISDPSSNMDMDMDINPSEIPPFTTESQTKINKIQKNINKIQKRIIEMETYLQEREELPDEKLAA